MPRTADTSPNGARPTETFTISPFPLDRGDVVLPSLVLAYRTYGNQSPGCKTVIVSTCFGEKLVDEYPLIGENKSLDPAEYFIIKIGLLGGSDSSSPSNTPPPFARADFPHVTYGDMVRAQKALCDHLGVKELFAVVGFSMGGQLAYHFGVLYPSMVKNLVCLATSATTSIHNIAFLEGPKAALIASGSYDVGSKGPKAFGRAYCAWAMSHDWFQQKKWEDTGATSLEDYIMKGWEGGMGTWDGYDLLSLARTWQSADLTLANLTAGYKPVHTSTADALKSMTPVRVLVMPSRTDLYFVPEDSEREVASLPHGKLAVIETIYGHIGGGGGGTKADDAFIDNEIKQWLA